MSTEKEKKAPLSDRRSFIVRMARGVGLAAPGIVVIDTNSCIAFWGIQGEAWAFPSEHL